MWTKWRMRVKRKKEKSSAQLLKGGKAGWGSKRFEYMKAIRKILNTL